MGPHGAAAHHHGWRAEIEHAGAAATGIRSVDDLIPYQDALAGATVATPADLGHRIVEVAAVTKAS